MSDSPAPPDNRTDRLGTERVGKLLLEFSIPAIVSMVFNTLYNVVDTIFLGQALPDGSGVAVTTLALPVMTLLMGFSMIAGQGGNALAAIQLGKGEKNQVERTLGNSATLLVGISVVIAVMSGSSSTPSSRASARPMSFGTLLRLSFRLSASASSSNRLAWGSTTSCALREGPTSHSAP